MKRYHFYCAGALRRCTSRIANLCHATWARSSRLVVRIARCGMCAACPLGTDLTMLGCDTPRYMHVANLHRMQLPRVAVAHLHCKQYLIVACFLAQSVHLESFARRPQSGALQQTPDRACRHLDRARRQSTRCWSLERSHFTL